MPNCWPGGWIRPGDGWKRPAAGMSWRTSRPAPRTGSPVPASAPWAPASTGSTCASDGCATSRPNSRGNSSRVRPARSAVPPTTREQARAGEGHVDQATEDAAEGAHRRAEQARTEAEHALGAVRERYAAARAEAVEGAEAAVTDSAAADPTADALAALVDTLTREHAQAYRTAAGMHAAREALAAAEREQAQRAEDRQHAERRAAARTSRREGLDGEQAALEEVLAQARGESGSVTEHAALLQNRVALLVEAATTVREEESAAARLKDADDRLADAAFRAGFDTPQAAADTLLADAGQRALQHRIDAWQAEAAAVADRLAETDARAAADRAPAVPEVAQPAYDAAERLLRDASAALASARERCAELGRLSRRAADEVRGLGPVREEFERVARLAGLTAGTSADNERKMRLESYVLAARLEQVAEAATARLRRMSSGRYQLVHSDARTGGRRVRPRTARHRRLDGARTRHGHTLRRRDVLRLARPGTGPRRRGHRRGGRRAAGHPVHRRGFRQPRRADPGRGARRAGLPA